MGQGLSTGVHATGSALSFGLYNGGAYQSQVGYSTSRGLAVFGRDTLLQAGAGRVVGGVLSRLPRLPRPPAPATGGAVQVLGRKVVQRALTRGDLGVKGTISQLKGVFSVVDDEAVVRIDYIEGRILNPTEIIKNLSQLARAHGAKRLRIEGTLANERLFEVLTRRYGLQSRGATDFIEVILK